MLIELFLVLGSGALGGRHRICRWPPGPTTAMFDGVMVKNDQKHDHPGVLRMRALRRTRTGWVWLTFGAWLTFFGSLISLLTP